MRITWLLPATLLISCVATPQRPHAPPLPLSTTNAIQGYKTCVHDNTELLKRADAEPDNIADAVLSRCEIQHDNVRAELHKYYDTITTDTSITEPAIRRIESEYQIKLRRYVINAVVSERVISK